MTSDSQHEVTLPTTTTNLAISGGIWGCHNLRGAVHNPNLVCGSQRYTASQYPGNHIAHRVLATQGRGLWPSDSEPPSA